MHFWLLPTAVLCTGIFCVSTCNHKDSTQSMQKGCLVSLPLPPIGHRYPDGNSCQISSPEIKHLFFSLFPWRRWHHPWFLLNTIVYCLSAPNFHFLGMKSCLLQLSLHLQPPCKEVTSAVPMLSLFSTHGYNSKTDWHKIPKNNPPCPIPHIPIVFNT